MIWLTRGGWAGKNYTDKETLKVGGGGSLG